MLKLDKSLISSLGPFKSLRIAELDGILEGACSTQYSKNLPIFRQGQAAQFFYLLLAGHIRVERAAPDGNQDVVRYINQGEFFGIAVAMGRDTFPAGAVAVDDCIVLSWPNSNWIDLQARYPSFCDAIYRTMGTRLQETQQRCIEMAAEQSEQRVAHALLGLANQAGRKTDEGIEIEFPVTGQDIADIAGTTFHTVNRLLGSWEADGIIRWRRRKVIVVDVRRLMLVAENRCRT